MKKYWGKNNVVDYSSKAKELFKSGYNCAQAVFLAFSDITGMDEKTAAMLSSSFGGGMGRMREVCGAVSGMFMIAGMLYGYDDPKARVEKKEHYELIQYLAEEFKKETGSIICRELLGKQGDDASPAPTQRTDQYYKKRPCVELVGICAGIIQRYIEQNTL